MASVGESLQNPAGCDSTSYPLALASANTQETEKNNIVQNIIETERKYVQDLEIVKKCLNSLLKSNMTQNTFLLLSLKFDSIVQFQWKFLSRFESTAEMPWKAQRWGWLFLESEAQFEVYVAYCLEYIRTAGFMSSDKHATTSFGRIFGIRGELSPLFLKPSQRIAEYSSLLASLIQACSIDDYPYYEELKQGLDIVRRIIDKISEAQQHTEKELAIKNLARRVDDWKGHHLERFGELLLNDICVINKTEVDREYHVFLFEKILLCCKEAQRPTNSLLKSWKSHFGWKKQTILSPSSTLPGQSGQSIRKNTPLVLKGRILIGKVTQACPNMRDSASHYPLSVWWKGDDDLEYFTLQFQREEQMRKWEAEISRLIRDIAQRRTPLKSTDSSSSSMSPTRCPSDNHEMRQAHNSDEQIEKSLNLNGSGPAGRPSDDEFNVEYDERTSEPNMTIVRRLDGIFKDVERYKRLLRCPESEAQKVLDVFQTLIVATQRLSRQVGLYPTCYVLNGIELIGDDPVACGTFADIYKGRFGGQNVCLKVIRLYQTSHADFFLKQFSAEAILWGQLLHQNLLPIYGFFRYNARLCLVSPWMEHGDVKAFLRHHPDANRVLLVSDVASGLAYLHDHNIVHGDIKGVNILVSNSRRACLADFGISSVTDTEILHWTSDSSAASKGGSIRWQAPELFDLEDDHVVHNSKASDVYALACVVYEIFTGKLPFFEFGRDSVIMRKVKQGVRPSRPSTTSFSWELWGLTESLWSLMERCWSENPDSRPTAQAIMALLSTNNPVDDRPVGDGEMLSPPRFRSTQSSKLQALSLGDIEAALESFTR